MKSYIFFLIVMTMHAAHSIAMDLSEKTPLILSSVQQKNKHTTSISEAINKAIEDSSFCCGLCTKIFVEQDHFDLIKYVDRCYPKGMCEKDIHTLKKKNSYFAASIDYFCDIAKKNYDAVTLSTLNIVTNHEQKQPTSQLEALPSALKKYVMAMAYNKLRRVHSIEFIGHTAPVRRVALNHEKNLACSASKDGTFRLWNLETGKQLYILKELAVSGYVTFNNAGTLLATATLLQEEPFEITIKIWDTDSQKALWNIQHQNRFSALAFFQGQTDITLAILGQNSSTLYTLKKDHEPMCIGNNMQGIPISVDKGYKIKKRKEDHAWIAEKSSPRLYLLERAIENTPAPTVINIHKSPLYKKLLQSEKDIVNALFKTKYLDTYTPIN